VDSGLGQGVTGYPSGGIAEPGHMMPGRQPGTEYIRFMLHVVLAMVREERDCEGGVFTFPFIKIYSGEHLDN
jgi:hypothetical protein